MDWQWWCIVLCLCYGARCFECPEGSGCTDCQSYPGNEYEISCSTSDVGLVRVKIRPSESLKLTCRKPINWTDFHLGASNRVGSIKSLYFKSCELSDTKPLDEIAKQLLIDEVEYLQFVSYSNLSSGLRRETFGGFGSLKELTLSSNSLTELPVDMLTDFPQLKLLNLRDNNLRTLPTNFFDSPTLEVVELGTNDLETLEPRIFGRVDRLRLLNIWNNKLVTVMPGTFENMTSLEVLSLQRNNLTGLPGNIFSSLAKLKSVNLSNNNFSLSTLPTDLLKNCSGLENFKFMENKRNLTTLPSQFFANLKNLKTVDILKLGLKVLPEDLFDGAINLRNLSIQKNYLETLPAGIFNSTRKLTTLELRFNEISSLPDNVFTGLSELVKLDLSKNHIAHISENLFSGLISLRELNMEMNGMIGMDFYALKSLGNLQIARFSHNALTLKSVWGTNGSPFRSSLQLEKLYLDHNNISDIFDDWVHSTSLKVLNLSHNKLQYLKDLDLQFLSKDVYVDVTYNNISHINFDTVELWAVGRTSPSDIVIAIGNNPIQCDCRLYDLLRYLEGRLHPNVQEAFRLIAADLKCAGPPEMRGNLVKKFESKTLLCDVVHHDVTQYDCIDQCKCSMRPEDQVLVVNCTGLGLTAVSPTLRVPLTQLVELHLNDNYLRSMPTMTLPCYRHVVLLDLSHNNISTTNVDSLVPNFKVLRLDHNQLTTLDTEFIKALSSSQTSLRELSLQSNPWECDCGSREFLSFVQLHSTKIKNLSRLTCANDKRPLIEMTPEDLCPGVDVGWVIATCLTVGLFGVIMGSLTGFYYRYQREIKVWLYAKNWCLWWVTEDELDRDKLYDAFISYSHKDEDFVVNDLIPKLERSERIGSQPPSKSFKLCVHFRDWLAGEWIPKQIARSVEESRRTIVVLSPNFLESVWGRMEFRAAHSQALSEGRARVIVILYGDIGPTDDLDPELKAYLSTNTYVKWGDPWFWEKLYYAMPHPAVVVAKRKSGGNAGKNAGKKIFESMQPPSPRAPSVKQDKSELIDDRSAINADPAQSTIASSTPPADSVHKIFIEY